MKLAGQTVLLTGAASGLGRELARALAARGCCLYLVDRDLAGLRVVGQELAGQVVGQHQCDLADPAQRLRLLATVRAELPWLGLLINCAGLGSHSTLPQLSTAEVSQVLQVNTLAPLELAAGLYPLLAAGPAACVVNIGSTAGEAAMPSMSLYCASKAALHAFTRALSVELSGSAVRTLLVVLGSLRDTGFAQSIRHAAGRQSGWYRRLDARPTAVARAIVSAIEHDRPLLVHPAWYGPVLWLTQALAPVTTAVLQVGYRHWRAAPAQGAAVIRPVQKRSDAPEGEP